MMEPYRKHGHTLRLERYAEARALLQMTECGEAFVEEGTFIARPFACGEPPAGASPRSDALQEIERRLVYSRFVEHLVIVTGTAHHECGDRQWQERFARIHVTLTRGGTDPLRVSIDTGSDEIEQIDLGAIESVIAALTTSDPGDIAPGTIELTPHVTAQVTRILAGTITPDIRLQQPLAIEQRPPAAYGRDGTGMPVSRVEIVSAGSRGTTRSSPPNFYRPSYRAAPVRHPLHLALRRELVTASRDLPRAIAVTRMSATTELVELTLLVEHERRSRVQTVRLSPRELADSVVPAADEWTWFPLDGGTWGCTAVLAIP